MTCLFYKGQQDIKQPIRIACANFNINLNISNVLKFAFWLKNPKIASL